MKEYSKEDFQAEKDDILGREDLSRVGRIDPEIQHIVDRVNEHPALCTTSSCAGRITLLERKSNRKIDSKWLIASHQPVTPEQILPLLQSEYDVWMMQESFILHVFCQTIEAAEEFLRLCRQCGFKRSGITASEQKIMIEVLGNEKVEAPLILQGRKIFPEEHIPDIIDCCNARMKRNREKMEQFYDLLKPVVEKHSPRE